MVIVCVQVHVKPEHIDDFIRASQANHEGTRRTEPGNLRWDLVQAEGDPSRFMLYEVYRSVEAYQAHQETNHFLHWREVVAAYMAEPRTRTMYHSVFPTNNAWE